jgi:tRNA G10  N-methylase Trm11
LDNSRKFVCVLSFGKLSLLELIRLHSSGNFHFAFLSTSDETALLECDAETAKRLAKTSGGIFKIGEVCGGTLEALGKCLPLPDDAKFNWTVSCYGGDGDVLEETKDYVSGVLKEASLGKARFVRPEISGDVAEIKIAELCKNVLAKTESRSKGFDVIVDQSSPVASYGYTRFAPDLDAYRERDFGRLYQDPTLTIGPRLARVLVNLCGLERGKTLLDPFCGLGTIMQEALLAGYSMVGIEISSAEAKRCRDNLAWFRKRFQVSPKLASTVIRADTTEIQRSELPRIDGIATEPILLAKLEGNPTREEAGQILRVASAKYRDAFHAFSNLLTRGAIVSIVGPDLIDDRGKTHSLDLAAISNECGFALILPKEPFAENPCTVPTTKKKIIHRKVYLLEKV